MIKDPYSPLATSKAMPSDCYDKYLDIFDTAPESLCKELYEPFLQQIQVTEGLSGAHVVDTHQIELDVLKDLYREPKGEGTTFFHEAAHWIDYQLFWLVDGRYGLPYTQEFSGLVLARSLINEANERIAAFAEKEHINESQARSLLFKELRAMDKSRSHNLSVLLDGIFQGRYANQLPYAQGAGYWGKDTFWLWQLCKEAFAEIMEAHISSPEGLQLLEEFFPKSMKAFYELAELMMEDLNSLEEPVWDHGLLH